MTLSDPSDTYAGRSKAILASVRAFPEVGISVADLRVGLPFEATSAEIRGKLVTLRAQDHVETRGDGRWYPR